MGGSMTHVARIVWIALVATFTTAIGRAVEATWDYSVQIDSVVQTAPAKITLHWAQDTAGVPASYTVYRKAPAESSWGTGTKLPGTVTTYADSAVEVGRSYEYRVVKATSLYTGYGYIQAGIAVPLVDDRGAVVLIVDQTQAEPLTAELIRLEQDLVGDGWTVLRHDVGRTDAVTSVKALIKADYEADPARVKSVFLFGHVPVPYSGRLNPDKHPDHTGAWPADVYYADLYGQWTDESVDYRQCLNPDLADAARLTNVPGDGKFDQSVIPGVVELQLGRVDLANMPGRAGPTGTPSFLNETELLRQYLNKDHNFRHQLLTVNRRAIVGDYFGVRGGEAFSASGYRSFAPLVGTANVTNLNLAGKTTGDRWISALASRDYLLAYGCGPGSYQTIDGIGSRGSFHDGSTVDIVQNNVQAVFTLIFGSWLGDWDHEDDLMRSILAAPTCTLTAAWSGRPHWFVHPMGLGETIGYTARLTQNNTGLYQNELNLAAHEIHIALMGDPTLRLHPVAPIGSIRGTATATGLTLTWKPSVEATVGYHVYRATAENPAFTRLTSAPTTETTFADAAATPAAVYMVRAVKLECTPSGSYYNASQGIFWNADEIYARDTRRLGPVAAVAGNAEPRIAKLDTHNSRPADRAHAPAGQ
jgi:hypothetical protein